MGDLRDHLSTHSSDEYPWSDKIQSIQSIVFGLAYLHSFDPPIIHRDLKSRNVLLDSEKGTKLTDFGVSREVDDSTLTNGVGTFQWMAPEIMRGNAYTVAADVYSFGVLLSEFSTHQVPYSTLTNPSTNKPYQPQYLINQVAKGEISPVFETTNTPLWVIEMGKQCLSLDPNDRPNCEELSSILRHLK